MEHKMLLKSLLIKVLSPSGGVTKLSRYWSIANCNCTTWAQQKFDQELTTKIEKMPPLDKTHVKTDTPAIGLIKTWKCTTPAILCFPSQANSLARMCGSLPFAAALEVMSAGPSNAAVWRMYQCDQTGPVKCNWTLSPLDDAGKSKLSQLSSKNFYEYHRNASQLGLLLETLRYHGIWLRNLQCQPEICLYAISSALYSLVLYGSLQVCTTHCCMVQMDFVNAGADS